MHINNKLVYIGKIVLYFSSKAIEIQLKICLDNFADLFFK